MARTEPPHDTADSAPGARPPEAGQSAISFALVSLCWTLLILLLAGWDYYHARQSALNSARTAARHSYAKDLTFRKWATGHGGLYAPVTPGNPPNDDLAHIPERDIVTPSGRPLTLINPAYMLRQIHELADDTFGTRAHITSLRPIRPGNTPDPWEAATLAAFERGETERSALDTIGDTTYLRLMRPIMVDTGCLKCHAAQGYQMGDIRGGISVSIPWAPYRDELRSYLVLHVIGYGGLWSLGLLGIAVSRRRLRKNLRERDRGEDELRKERQRLAGIIEGTRAGIWEWNVQSGKIAITEIWAKMLGYRLDELSPMTIKIWESLAHPDDLPRVYALLERHFAGELSYYDGECRMRHKDGHWVWIHDRGRIQNRDDEGKPLLMFGTHTDITPRKEAEAQLRHSHGLMQYIIEHDPNAVAVLDQSFHYLFVSNRFLDDYKITRQDIIGKSHYEIFPEITDYWREVHRRALAGEVLSAEDERFERADGSVDYVRWQCRPWHESDDSIGGIVLYTEVITPRKEAEEALRQKARELEERSSELERFNYTVSHDLKSPLVTVKAFLGFLEQDIAERNAERIESDIGHMRAATEKMGRLLDELLEMSRIGRVVNPPEEFSFKQLLEDVLSLMAGPLAERGVAIVTDDMDPPLRGDRPRLLEIWQNLIENAVKYMGDQPEPRIELGAEEAQGMLVFFVRDNGLGIDPRYREKIFGLFEKLDAKSEGSGLGLALVKRIVDLYGGRIWVESDGAGQGCCFRFTLPGALHR